MPLDPDRLSSHAFPPRPVAYAARDAILYALSCGAGVDGDLRFVHEAGLHVLPSFGQTLCFDDAWIAECGIALSRVVHGGLDLRLHRPFAPAAELRLRSRIAGLTDKGAGRGGLILQQSDVLDGKAVIFTSYSSLFVIGGGGFGGSRGMQTETIRVPEMPPDATARIETRPDAPLLFRLLGDRNPLHVLPAAARAAGFDRPIMHGANTFGLVCHDLLTRFCAGEPGRLRRFAARFSGPLFPGEALTVAYWQAAGGLRFAARAAGRDGPVLDGGLAELGAP